MANTYTQIHIQFVFAVKGRSSLISNKWQEDLFRYITGIVQMNEHKMLQINGMPDHIHILIGMRPKQSISDLMQEVKGSSSKWINANKLVVGKFAWQEGYGAFSYSKDQVPRVIKYIRDQEEHHKTVGFREEYLELLKEMGVEYDERYLFEPVQ